MALQLALFLLPTFYGPADQFLQVLWFGAPRATVILVDLLAISVIHSRTGISNELPTDHASVTSMQGVAEHSFDRMRAQHSEEQGFLDRPQLFILFFHFQIGKS